MARDFSYGSGERQTGTQISDIRNDHLARYRFAVSFLKQERAASIVRIADVFCGNGYGTWLLASELDVDSVLGIDGSEEAIEVAKNHYLLPHTQYKARIFPFEIEKRNYDAIVCFESIEHVIDCNGMLRMLVNGLKENGYLILSTPNEASMPFQLNNRRFTHHTKHFTMSEIETMAKEVSVRIVRTAGQTVYESDNSVVGDIDPAAHMDLEQFRPDHQFLIAVLQKGTANTTAG